MASSKVNKATPSGGNRRDRLASFETARKAEQRRRTIGLLALCLVLAIGLLSYPVYLMAQDYQARNATVAELGVSAAAAGCEPVQENPATGNQEHVPDGTPVTYSQHPADSGPHYVNPAPFTKRFYTADDRPEIGTLVHNLEHGYTLVWYRPTAPAEQITQLENVAKTFGGDDARLTDKFIAAPWSDADGEGFPAGKDVMIAHWYADPANPTDTTKQKGIRQACTQVSGEAIRDFMTKYPYSDSPEPQGA